MAATTPPKKAVESAGPTPSSKFKYTTDSGVEIELVSLKHLPPKVSRRTRAMNSENRFWSTVEILLGTEGPEIEAIEDMTEEEFDRFNDQWREFSGIDLEK